MKNYVTLFLLLVIAGAFGAVYLDEGFESGTLDGVTIIDDDGDTNNWQVSAIPGKGGVYWAESVSTGLTPDNTMVFPSTWMELDTYLNFWVGGTNAGSSEHLEIYVADDNIDPSNFIMVYDSVFTTNSLENVEVSLRPYLLQLNEWFWDSNVTIKVRHYNTEVNNGAGSALVIDDFRAIYYPTFNYDDPAELPQGVVSPMSNLHFVWDFWDFSSLDENWEYIGWNTTPIMNYIITNESGVVEESYIELTPNTESEFNWTYYGDLTGWPMGTNIEYWCKVVDNTTYAIESESEHFFVEWGEISYVQGFDDSNLLPEGWSVFSTGYKFSTFDYPWKVNEVNQNVYEGQNSITSAAQSNFGVYETEDYLVSPMMRVDGDAKLQYFVNQQTPEGYEDTYIVLINTIGGDSTTIVNSSDTLFTETLVAGEFDNIWNERVIELNPWDGNFIWIAFKHVYTPIDAKLDRYLNLDEISVAELPALEVDYDGPAAYPGVDYPVNAVASDYSGINNLTIHYSLDGEAEQLIVMNDNGDGTYSAGIPGQTEGTKCSWYVVATDDSPYQNKTTSDKNNIIWFNDAWLEWGSTGTSYSDYPDPINAGDKVAMDWNFGTKDNLYLKQIEIGWAYDAPNMPWKLVEFDPESGNLDAEENPIGEPTENIIGDLYGINTFTSGGDILILEGKNTVVSGHVALVFETNTYNEIMLDESGDKSHAWQWNSVNHWVTNLWGAFYIKMYVSLEPDGIEEEFVSSTTELCQNYPNPFNPITSISFYNRLPGKVELSVFNTLGEKVATLINKNMSEGYNKVEFDASKFNSGVYYYTLNTPEKSLTKKMILIK